MKNKKLIIILAAALAVVAAAVVILVVVLGGNNEGDGSMQTIVEAMEQSRQSLKVVDTDVTVSDGGVTVYTFSKELAIDNKGVGSLEIINGKLNASYVIQEHKEYQVINDVDRSGILNFVVDESTVENIIPASDGVYTVVVVNGSIAEFLGYEGELDANNPTVTVTIVDGKVTLINCSFTMQSGKTVQMVTECTF